MKKIFTFAFAAIFSMGAMAQLDRSQRPEAGPAPELEFGDYDVIELKNGLKLICVEDHKLPRISMNLIIDRDPIFEGEKAGYVSLAGEMLRQGTTTMDKATLDEKVDQMGAQLFTGSTSIFASGLSKSTEELLKIIADVARNPRWDTAEFAKLKKQQISGIESNKEDASVIGGQVYDALIYGKEHPYGEMMTVETVEEVDIDDAKTYYNNYWMPNIAYLAVVGDFSTKKMKKMAKKYFGKWEQKNVPRNIFEQPKKANGTPVAIVNRDASVQTVINIGNTIDLKPGDEDIIKLRLANQILGVGSLGRLFQNIREDKAYTYGAYSSYDEDRLVGEFSANASVRNEVTDSAVQEFINEFQRMRSEPVEEKELQGAKNFIIGSFGRSLEQPQTVANFALNIERYDLDDDYYEDYLKKLGDLTAQDVMDAAQKYITTDAMHIVLVGKASDFDEKMERFGKVSYYDEEANAAGKPSMPIPDTLSAEKVVNRYIKMIGGEENLKKVKDVTIKLNMEMAGMPPGITATEIYKLPNMHKTMVEMPGRGVMQSEIYDGKIGKTSMMGQEQTAEEDELESMKLEANPFPERNYMDEGYNVILTKVAMVDGQKAVAMDVTNPAGKKSTEYYDLESGLKVKVEQSEETPQGPVSVSANYSDYREVKGVMFPYKIVQKAGPQVIKMNVTEVKVNSGVKVSEFK